MSSENLDKEHAELFFWNHSDTAGEALGDYVLATYYIATPVAGEQAALGLAREQSICATRLNDVEMPADLESFCARVVDVVELEELGPEVAALYFLNTPVYSPGGSGDLQRRFKVVIAYPTILFGSSLTRLWNSIFGEVHRLGFLSAASLVELALPAELAEQFAGPHFGVEGIRNKLDVQDRPLFCRSMRPASGLTTQMMLQLNERVLSGGFDIIKDDELTYDCARSPFLERVQRMVHMKRRVEDETGERKLYFANIIDDFSTSLALAEQAAEAGADGVLVSTSAQGLSFIKEVRNRTELIVLAHNSCGDALTRSPHWGASDAVMASLQRAAGADLVVSPGPFATPFQNEQANSKFLRACSGPLGNCAATLPIIQGGKQPEHLAQYTSDVGSINYMIIAATWLDNHPDGIASGARAFRYAWTELAPHLDSA